MVRLILVFCQKYALWHETPLTYKVLGEGVFVFSDIENGQKCASPKRDSPTQECIPG